MYNDVASFDSNDLYSTYSPLGRNFGHPGLNTAVQMLFGQNYMPSSDNGQSMYEAMLQRNRTTEFMNLQRSGLLNNGMVRRVGLGGNPALGLMSGMASPDSALARTVAPFLGGNPMAAQMQIYAGMAGAGVMGNFGRMGSISSGETEAVMQALEKNFYKSQKYENEGGVRGAREELNAQGKEALRSIARGPNADKVFEDMGFKGIKADKEGKLNAKGEDLVKKFNIMDDNDPLVKRLDTQTRVKQDTSSMLSAELDSLLKQENGEIDKDLRKGFLNKVQRTMKLSREEYQKFITKDSQGKYKAGVSQGDLDIEAARDEIDKLKAASPLTAIRAQGKAIEKAGGTVKGFAFEKSRGFKIEDFTSAFVKASDLRMLGDRKGLGVAASMDEFASGAGGALSAARAVFGNKSGAELVEKISNIAGPEANLGNEQGAKDVEELLRKVNATARVAGISIKTMLSIIDAGKQLAANHPALQSTSSAAITQLSMRAVGTAVSLGATMSATDYRKAGAAQGIASQEIKTAQEFAAGPVGSTIAAAYYGATKEQKAELDKLLGNKPVTGRSLDEGLREGMAKIRGMSVGTLHRLSTDNPQLVAEAMKVTDLADRLHRSAKPAITSAMMENLNSAGLSTDEMQELYKSSKGDFSQVDARVRQFLYTDEGNRTWQHAQIGVREMLEDSQRTDPGERAAYEKFRKLRDQSAADETKMDQKYGSKYAPIVTQAVDVLSSGGTFKEMTSAFTHIFATSNQNTDKANTALEAAQASGAEIAKAAGAKGVSDETKFKKGGLTDALNKFIADRITVGNEMGDTSATADLGSVKQQELITAAKMGGQMKIKDTESAQAELEKLEKESSENKNWNSDEYLGSRNRLTTLRSWKKLGVLGDNKALNIAQRGGAAALSAATVQAAASANYKKDFEAAQAELTGGMGKQLNALSNLTGVDSQKAADAQYLNNYYTGKSGSVDLLKMLKDKQKGEGAFGDTTGWGKAYWENREASDILNTTQDQINNVATKTGIMNETSPDLESRKDLGNVMKDLIDVLGDNGSIGRGLGELIGAINGAF